MSAEVLYTARLLGPVIVEKGRANTLACPIYRDGVVVAPSAGTVTIWSPGGSVLVSAAAVTVNATTGFAEYELLAETVAAEPYADGFRFEWTLTLAGQARTFRGTGSLVYRRLYPVVTDLDLTSRHHDLPRRLAAAKLPSLQDYLDNAWAEIESRLVETGKRPHLVADPSAFRRVHLLLALNLVFDDLSSTPESNDDSRARQYSDRYEAAWNELTFPQAARDGTLEAGRRRAGRPTTWLCSRS